LLVRKIVSTHTTMQSKFVYGLKAIRTFVEFGELGYKRTL